MASNDQARLLSGISLVQRVTINQAQSEKPDGHIFRYKGDSQSGLHSNVGAPSINCVPDCIRRPEQDKSFGRNLPVGEAAAFFLPSGYLCVSQRSY
jgi:hypothetical protein